LYNFRCNLIYDNILHYIIIVGGVKNTIKACVGYSMTGEKLTTGERLLVGGLGVASVIIDVFTFGIGKMYLQLHMPNNLLH
jgi:hypothetical protein